MIKSLRHHGILIISHTRKEVAEESQKAYKDVALVVDAAEKTGLAQKVAELRPVICVKG